MLGVVLWRKTCSIVKGVISWFLIPQNVLDVPETICCLSVKHQVVFRNPIVLIRR